MSSMTATTMSSISSSVNIKNGPEYFSSYQHPHLPLELFRIVISQITARGSLHALTLSSSWLRSEVEPFLYESPMSHYPSPTLSPPLPHIQFTREAIDDRNTHLAFLRTITSTPRLALLVRSYQSIEVLHSSDKELCRYTSMALCMMHRLKELRVRSLGISPLVEQLLLGLDERLDTYEDLANYISKIEAEKSSSTDSKIACEGKLEARADSAMRGRPSFQLHTIFWGSLPPEYFGLLAFLHTQHALRAVSMPHSSYLTVYKGGLGSAELAQLKILAISNSSFIHLLSPFIGLEVLELEPNSEEDLAELHTLPSLRQLILSIPLLDLKPMILFLFEIVDPLFVVNDDTNVTASGNTDTNTGFESEDDSDSGANSESANSESANSESEAHTDSDINSENSSDYETESDSESAANSNHFSYSKFGPHFYSYDHNTTLPHRPTSIPPREITALFASCPKLEMVDVAIGAELIPPEIMERFLGEAGKRREGEVVTLLYARWRRSMFEREGDSREFELLTVDQVRRGRTMAYW